MNSESLVAIVFVAVTVNPQTADTKESEIKFTEKIASVNKSLSGTNYQGDCRGLGQ